MLRSDRVGAALGALGIIGNVLGVAFLVDVDGAYRVAGLDAWAAASAAHPRATVASAASFTVGLVALAGWALAMGRRAGGPAAKRTSGLRPQMEVDRGTTGELARWGAAAMALGAVLNGAGTITPAVLVLHVLPCAGEACAPVARGLLGITLTLDALFNLLFGVGLVLVAAAFARVERRPVLAVLGVVAGLATIPVSLQFAVDAASDLLAIAGPLWLAYVAATSVLLWRGAGQHSFPVSTDPRGARDAAMAGSR